jgi:hypothetical protein
MDPKQILAKFVEYHRTRNAFTREVVALLGVLYAYMSFLRHCSFWCYWCDEMEAMDAVPSLIVLAYFIWIYAYSIYIFACGIFISVQLLESHCVAQGRLRVPLKPCPASPVAGSLALCFYIAKSWDYLEDETLGRALWMYNCFLYFWSAYWVEWYTGILGRLVN